MGARRSVLRRAGLGLALLGVALGAAGCGGDPGGERVPGTKFAVYVDVPLRGPWGAQGRAIANGAQLAIADLDGGSGVFPIRLSVKDVTDSDGRSVNAEGAASAAGALVRDPGAVAAIGGLDPVANRVLVQLAGQDGVATVLASGDRGSGTTADLSPRGRRLFVDLGAPGSAIDGALARRAAALGCRRTVRVRVRAPGPPGSPSPAAVAPRGTLTATTYDDPALRSGLRRALGRRTDCVTVDGEPSAGDPADLLGPLARRLRGVRLLLTRGAASTAVSTLARTHRIRAEAIVDDVDPRATADGRRIDAAYRRHFGSPAPVGAIAGYRAVVMALRAFAAAGFRPGDFVTRRGVADGLLRVAAPGPPRTGTQDADGDVTPAPVGLARPAAYGWRVVRGVGGD